MSSKSLAAARARRAGEAAPPVSGNRPITSIGSNAAFAQQMPPNYAYNMPPPPNNVRIAKAPLQPKMPPQQQAQYAQNHYMNEPQQNQNGLPFSKLTISDAIGLVTLRLGRVEQYMIDLENEKNNADETDSHSHLHSNMNIPENSKIIDTSVLTNIVSRLDSLEKKEPTTVNIANNESMEKVNKVSEDVTKITEQITRLGDEVTKHNLTIAKHTEQLYRFERELVETKDILKTFMIKYDMFAKEINDKFADYECALTDIEANVQNLNTVNASTIVGDSVNEIVNDNASNNRTENEENENEKDNSVFMSVDLKNIIKNELANSSS